MQVMISLTLTFCFIGLVFAKRSPVLLWGADSIDNKPSLPVVTNEKFVEQLVIPLLNKTLVVFMEKDLSSKDFMCNNNVGKSCFTHLHQVDKIYYASVENPIEALRTIGGEHNYNSVDASGKLYKPIDEGANKITFLKFDDGKKSTLRGLRLQSHDSIIANITSQLGDKVFFMYVSLPSESSLKRQRRESSDTAQDYVFRDKNNLLFFYKSLMIKKGQNPPESFEMEKYNVHVVNDTAMSVTLDAKNGPSLTFDITLAGGYFFMKNVMYDNQNFLSSNVYAPTDFSYFCGNLTLNNIPKNNDPLYTLKWDYLQFQAPFGYIKNESFVFGDAWHCVGFFTGGILSGLLIVALLLTITFIGACWMMDINTMDRFDDPKGKTITVNVSD